MLTLFGTAAVTVMAAAYALERRYLRAHLAFAGGCAFSSVYAFAIGSVPFGVVEALWAAVALRRWVGGGS